MNDFNFLAAKPVWVKGRETEKNLSLSFKIVFNVIEGADLLLRVTASTIYRLFVNDELAGYGPARAAHKFYRVDEINLEQYIKKGVNIVIIEVAGYNVNSYYLLDQPAFLQAELVDGGKIVAYTSEKCDGIESRILSERLQKVQRYSFQRPFIECYDLGTEYGEWKSRADILPNTLEICVTEDKKLIGRKINLPCFDEISVQKQMSNGRVSYNHIPENYVRDRSLTQISETLKGYAQQELVAHISDEIQEMKFDTINENTINITKNYSMLLEKDSFTIVDFGTNRSGFIGLNVVCTEDCTLYLLFDEILVAKDVDFKRMDCCNVVRYELKVGEYNLLTFEPYVLKFLKLIAKNGSCTIGKMVIKQYITDLKLKANFTSQNPKLNSIYNAAIETFKHNTVDLYMDCPSRERAGWLCDSFFIGRAEYVLTGKSIIERNFLENFLLAEKFDHLPDGMLPMCYPSDHNDGVFIPNWALWFIVELEEYQNRSKDHELVQAFKEKVYNLINYFKPFLNELGLIEKLPGWVFVEWSKANDLVQDVNFPTNMLFAGALETAGRLYGDNDLIQQGENIRRTINKLSFDGEFYIDNAVRVDGKLELSNERTEVCQYYAFFFNIATPNSHKKLFETLLNDFGPSRKINNKHPEIYFANSFIGNYLRLDILSRYGYGKKVLEDISGYFYVMSQKTGTLWEHDAEVASCDHGFTSVVTYWLLKHVDEID